VVLNTSQDKEWVTIIVHSSGYDRASYALSIAVAALATGLEVHLLLTWGGLTRFTQGHLEDLGEETSDQFRKSIQRGLSSGGITSIEQQIADAKQLGLMIYACAGTMATLNIARDDLVPQVDKVIGLVAFLEFARSASINWYI
jgi:peroxiredoxin family protein